MAFPEMAWDVGYLIHLCFHPHPIKPEWTLKVKGETVLDHAVFWLGRADRLVKTRRSPSPSGIWRVRLFSPQLGKRQNGNLSFIEWKYQKYTGYGELRRQNEKQK